MRQILAAALLLVTVSQPSPSEPTVRIGLNQNAASVVVRSASPFAIDQHSTRSATFSSVLAIDPAASGAVKASDLQYRMTAAIDGGDVLVIAPGAHVRIDPGGAPLEVDTRSYRGTLEVFTNARHTLTLVNELALEDYLRGVVPNELNPTTFGQIEALKAQAVAARTYIVRNIGQYKKEGYDVCATDACQVYFGLKTEEPLATQAVADTRGMVATYGGKPINALYSSTCGGRTEDAEHIFGEKVPYLVSVSCEYNHPMPMPFASSRSVPDWKAGVLAVAKVNSFAEAARFVGVPPHGEPPSMDAAPLAAFIRETFYPDVRTTSDESFVEEQGLVPAGAPVSRDDLLFRVLDRKNAFEWQQGVLVSYSGARMQLLVNGLPKTFTVAPDALIYHRIGDDRLAQRDGAWIGGELIDFRAEGTTIPILMYRINFANPAADRYSRVAVWQQHRTKADLDAAFASLKIGEFTDLHVITRGESDRNVSTEVAGSTGHATVAALKLRTLLGLRDSLFSYDIERNASGAVLGATFYGRGWGHGVGMCQVGAYGMALDGATYEEILKKYYTGIGLQRVY